MEIVPCLGMISGISAPWRAPAAFTKGFDLKDVSDCLYGKHLHVYSWPEGELKQIFDLGDSGLLPLEVTPNLAISAYSIFFFHKKPHLPLFCGAGKILARPG